MINSDTCFFKSFGIISAAPRFKYLRLIVFPISIVFGLNCLYAQRIPCVDTFPGDPYEILYKFNAQSEIIPESKILDCSMIPIGSPGTVESWY